jgi:hypothetical protein
MTNETKLNIAFEVRRTNDETGFAYVAGMNASVYAGSLATAKAKLRPMVEEQIKAAVTQVENYQQCVIGCANGTVLVCQFRHGNWGYEIAGPGRVHMSAVTGMPTFAECCVRAFRHAESSYDGVAWQLGAPSDSVLSEVREKIAA